MEVFVDTFKSTDLKVNFVHLVLSLLISLRSLVCSALDFKSISSDLVFGVSYSSLFGAEITLNE